MWDVNPACEHTDKQTLKQSATSLCQQKKQRYKNSKAVNTRSVVQVQELSKTICDWGVIEETVVYEHQQESTWQRTSNNIEMSEPAEKYTYTAQISYITLW